MNQKLSERFQTEMEFTLPKGYLDAEGVLHKHGIMRLARAADEIHSLRDIRVQQNPAFLPVIVLSRVLVKLGSLANIDSKVIEELFASDFDFLQRLYEKINSYEANELENEQPGLIGRMHGEGEA